MDFKYLIEVPEDSPEWTLKRTRVFSAYIYDSDSKYEENSSRWESFEETCTLLINTSEEIPRSEFLEYFRSMSDLVKVRILSQKNLYNSEDKLEHTSVSIFEIEHQVLTKISNEASPLLWFSLHNVNLISKYSRNIHYREGNHLNNNYFIERWHIFDYFFRMEEINKDLDRKIGALRSSGVSF